MSEKQKKLMDGIKQRPAIGTTPSSVSTPSRGGLYHLRERLERQLESSKGTPAKQVSPTLEKLKMTPGRVLKDREILANKHSTVRQKADQLNVGGGVCLWPGMQDMRLTTREILELILVCLLLVAAVLYGFDQLHGPTIQELQKYHKILQEFNDVHFVPISERMNSDLRIWHKEFRDLINQIHVSFDISKVPLLYIMYIIVYFGGMGLLIFFLVDNMLAKSKLSPNRVKQWVSILVVIGTWTTALFYFLLNAYMVESAIETNVNTLKHIMGHAIGRNIDCTTLSHMILYWQSIPQTGTLSVLGLVTIRDLMYYLQYYFIPIITILITPVIKLVMSLYSVYHVTDS